MVSNSWLRGFWTTSKNPDFRTEKAQIAVLAFEAASLMSKLLHLWKSLSDKQVAKTREEIINSIGIKKLVSDDDDYIGKLICSEMTENLVHVARAVSRLSKKCNDPLLKSFERAFNDLVRSGNDQYAWQFSWKKMDKKARKMERFIVTNTDLYQEMENLADLEQTLKRMRANDNSDSIILVEYEKKVAWKLQEVKRLKQSSLWNRTYDYVILLLARSLFTIYGRIGHVFGINQVADLGVDSSSATDIYDNRRVNSTVFMQSSVYPSENYLPRFSYGSLGKPVSASGPLLRTSNVENFHSGPLRNSKTGSSPFSGKHNGVSFYSGPLAKSSTKSSPSPVLKTSKGGTFKLWQFRKKSHDVIEKGPRKKPNNLTMSGPITGHVTSGSSSPLSASLFNSGNLYSRALDETKPQTLGNLLREKDLDVSSNKNKLLHAPPETLGAAALALHYSNLIIFIEKLVPSPHLIGNDARDDLYNMLPASIRAALRAKLKPCSNSLSSSDYDTVLANEWNDAITATLGWLAPLAHNTIRWQSERSFEHQNLVSKANVLLVQTLYFANQEKTEAAITELLMGLNYVWRFGREINAKSLAECASGRTVDEFVD